MDDLSMYIHDIVENSLNAEASDVKILIHQSTKDNQLLIEIVDNGKGMDSDTLKKVLNPFYTTRKTRNVGLGLSFFRESVIQTEGEFWIESTLGKGTVVHASYKRDHIDLPPLGDIAGTIVSILSDERVERLVFEYQTEQGTFQIDTQDIKRVLEVETLNNIEILYLIKQYIKDGILK